VRTAATEWQLNCGSNNNSNNNIGLLCLETYHLLKSLTEPTNSALFEENYGYPNTKSPGEVYDY
jgi:hypothetical protein